MLGRAIDAVVQLSIVVRGVVDGEEQVIWYAVGSGTVVSPDGLILTNQHLITPAGVDEKLAELEAQLAAEGKSADLRVDAERFMVAISDGRHLPDPRYVARVIAEDADLDLAVLRIDADERGAPLDPETLDLPVLPLGSSDAVNLGETVHVFGFPAIGSGSLTYTIGIVSGFLFEEGIDGTAWINTDAVTSGGNSGGAAVNDAGQLIGVPTSGSSLDCRAGDTNRDGVVGAGGRRLRADRRLADAVAADRSGPAAPGFGRCRGIGASWARQSTRRVSAPATDDLAASLSAAEGCAARGDWRCAANFYGDALANAPDDPAIATALYDAYLAARQAGGGGGTTGVRSFGVRGGGRDRFRPVRMRRWRSSGSRPTAGPSSSTASTGPSDSWPRATASRPAPTSEGAFTLTYFRTGTRLRLPTLGGRGSTGRSRISPRCCGSTRPAGDGMVTIETRTDPAGGQWVFAVDPTRQTWEVLQFDTAERAVRHLDRTVCLRRRPAVRGRSRPSSCACGRLPVLLVNGVDVAAAASAVLPEIGNRGQRQLRRVDGLRGQDSVLRLVRRDRALRAGLIRRLRSSSFRHNPIRRDSRDTVRRQVTQSSAMEQCPMTGIRHPASVAVLAALAACWRCLHRAMRRGRTPRRRRRSRAIRARARCSSLPLPGCAPIWSRRSPPRARCRRWPRCWTRALRADGGLRAPFPATTGTSLATLLTGTWPAEHGVVGDRFFRTGSPDFADFATWADPGLIQADTLPQAAERAGKQVVSVGWEGVSGARSAAWRPGRRWAGRVFPIRGGDEYRSCRSTGQRGTARRRLRARRSAAGGGMVGGSGVVQPGAGDRFHHPLPRSGRPESGSELRRLYLRLDRRCDQNYDRVLVAPEKDAAGSRRGSGLGSVGGSTGRADRRAGRSGSRILAEDHRSGARSQHVPPLLHRGQPRRRVVDRLRGSTRVRGAGWLRGGAQHRRRPSRRRRRRTARGRV